MLILSFLKFYNRDGLLEARCRWVGLTFVYRIECHRCTSYKPSRPSKKAKPSYVVSPSYYLIGILRTEVYLGSAWLEIITLLRIYNFALQLILVVVPSYTFICRLWNISYRCIASSIYTAAYILQTGPAYTNQPWPLKSHCLPPKSSQAHSD